MRNRLVLAFLISCVLLVSGLNAAIADGHSEGDWRDKLFDGDLLIDIRYRYEFVDQDGRDQNAHANTVRTRFGYRTAVFHDFQGLLEFENITHIGSARFNDTLNGRFDRPVVADPETTELNRGWINFSGLPQTNIRFGRHRIKYDNDRFVGNVGFRQNEQTFDGLRIQNWSVPGLKAEYAYIFGVQRIFGDDSRVGDFNTRNHFVNLRYEGFDFAKFVAYAYLLDIDDLPNRSSKTFGGRMTGKTAISDGLSLLYTFEAAYQGDRANNPNSFDLGYVFIEPGLSYGDVTLKLAFERLDSDGVNAFQTPFATLHAHQGDADIILATPGNGIDDYFATFIYKPSGPGLLKGVKFLARYHDYQAEEGNLDHGTELDLRLSRPIIPGLTGSLLYARYFAKNFAVDTSKFWVTLNFKY